MKHNGVWYATGQEYETEGTIAEAPEAEPKAEEQKVHAKRMRKRKTED